MLKTRFQALMLILTCCANCSFAQPLSSYGFIAFTGIYSPINGTAAPVSGGTTSDDAFSNGIPIGFPFVYSGHSYTTLSISWNGWVTLGEPIDSMTYTHINDLSNSQGYGLPRPILAPFWKDLRYFSDTQVRYATSGVAGSRKFTVQWRDAGIYPSVLPTVDIQLVLYEDSNMIDFVYRAAGTDTGSVTGCAIGITGGSGVPSGVVPFWSLNNAGTAPVASMEVETRNVINHPATGQVYRWYVCPPIGPINGYSILCPGSAFTFSDTTAGGVWSTSSGAIASIDTSGLLTAVSSGTTVISYSIGGGCYATAVVTVGLVPSINGATTLCPGITTTLTDGVGGGVWSIGSASVATIDSITGLLSAALLGITAVTYTLPTGCFATAIITVAVSPAPITGPFTGGRACVGQSIGLTNDDAGGTWSSGSMPVATVGSSTGIVTCITSGTATITYSLGAGCIVSAVVTVLPTPAAIAGETEVCIGHSITLSDSTAGGIWSCTAGATVDASGSVTGIAAGSSIVTYSLLSGCSAYHAVTVGAAPCATGVSVVADDDLLRVYPNPATDELMIKTDNSRYASFTITNNLGQVMIQRQLRSSQTNVPLTGLPAGVYYITLRGGERVIVQRFLKL